MRWEDERYVRVYTRDSGDWVALSFDAQGLFLLILRKADRAGIVKLGRRGSAAIGAVVGHPAISERLEAALTELLQDGCVALSGTDLVVPNFMAAQETKISDLQRKREQRARDREKAMSTTVTNGHEVSHGHEVGHEVSHAVTTCHALSRSVTPSRAVPSRTEPCLTEPTTTKAAPARSSLLLRANGPVPTVLKPEAPRETWEFQEFQQWMQWMRQQEGYVPEDPIPIVEGDLWWAKVMSWTGKVVQPICEAFIAFGNNPHWKSQNLPVRAFMKFWAKFIPQKPTEVSHA